MHQLTTKILRDRMQGIMVLTLAIVFLSACTTTPVSPTAALSAARDAIAIAEQAGARQYAGAELDEAQQKLIQAERSVTGEKMAEGETLARESMITAELASARTEAAKAEEINREMRRSADALTEEMRRTGAQ